MGHLVNDTVVNLTSYYKDKDIDNPHLGTKTTLWAFSETSLGNTLLDNEKTLGDQNIYDGKELYLISNPARESYTPLHDDLAESIVKGVKKNFPEWSSANGIQLSQWVVPIMATVVAFLSCWVGLVTHIAWYGRIPLALFLLLAGILAIIYTIPLVNTRVYNDPTRKSGTSSAISGYMFLAAAGVTCIPGDPTPYSLICAGVVTMAAAILLRNLLIDGLEVVNAAGLGAGAIMIISGLVCLGFSAIPNLHMTAYAAGSIVSAVSVVIMVYAVEASVSLVRLPMPYVPAQGDTFVRDTAADIKDIPPSADEKAIKNLINQDSKITGAWKARVGLLTAGVIMAFISTCVVAVTFPGSMVGAVFIVSVPLCLSFVALSDQDSMIRTVCMAGAAALSMAVPVMLLVSGHNTEFVGPFTVLAAVAMGIAVLWTSKSVNPSSPFPRSLYQVFQGVVIFGLFVEVAIMLDLYGVFRNM